MSETQWAFWLAVAALTAAAGKFIDDYHVKAATKAKVRDALVSWFLWLDERQVPDVGGAILKWFRRIFAVRNIILALIGLPLIYLATISAFYLGREIFGPENDEPYLQYVVTWIPFDETAPDWLIFIASIMLPACAGLVTMAYLFHKASLTDYDSARLFLIALGLIFGLGLSGGPAVYLSPAAGYGAPILILAGLASATLPGILAVCVFVLIVVRVAIKLVRSILLHVFDVVSSPSVSPFTYASALLGVAILAAKIMQAAPPIDFNTISNIAWRITRFL